MSISLLKFILLITLLLPSLSLNSVSADYDEEDYILDNPSASPYLRHKLLAIIKKGTQCDLLHNNVCNGVSANNGNSILFCCKKHCRNVLQDENNCGGCGIKVKKFQNCCEGKVAYLVNDPKNCGKCGKKCLSGVKCEYGVCGYA